MPVYTVRDTTTGKKVTFKWNGESPPSQSDMEQVFASARTRQPGILSRLGSDLAQRGRNIKEIFQTDFNPGGLPPWADFLGAAEAGTAAAMQGAGFLGADVPVEVGKGVYNTFAPDWLRNRVGDWKTGMEVLSKTPGGQKVLGGVKQASEGYRKFRERNKPTALMLEALGNSMMVGPAEGTLKALKGVGKATYAIPKEGVLGIRDILTSTMPDAPELTSQKLRKLMMKVSIPKGTGPEVDRALDRTEKAYKLIAKYKNDLEYVAQDGTLKVGRLPENTWDLLHSLPSVKNKIYNQYHSIAKRMNNRVKIDLSGISDVLKNRANTVFTEDRYPGMKKKLLKQAERFEKRQFYSPLDAEKAIKNLNESLANFKQMPDYGLTSMKDMDAEINNYLRKEMKTKLGKRYADLKGDYGAVLGLEGDLYNKAWQSGKTNLGANDVYGVYAGTRGVIHADPAVIAGVLAASGKRGVITLLDNPNRAVRLIFKTIESGKPKSMTGKKLVDLIEKNRLKKELEKAQTEAQGINAIVDRMNVTPQTPLLSSKPGMFSISSRLPYTNLPDRAAPVKRPYQPGPQILNPSNLSIPEELKMLSGIPAFLRTPEQMVRLRELQSQVPGVEVVPGLRPQRDVPNRQVILKNLLRKSAGPAGEPLPRDITAGEFPGKMIPEKKTVLPLPIRRNHVRVKAIQKWFNSLSQEEKNSIMKQLKRGHLKTEVAKEPWQMTREEFNGKGLKTYRGQTGIPFDIDIESGRYPGIIHSTPSKKVADIYAEGQRGTVTKLISKPHNVLDITDKGVLIGSDDILAKIAKTLRRKKLNGYELASALKDNGYDAVRLKEAIPGRHTAIETYAVLSEIADHKAIVKQALAEGKPVPAEVLKDYPDLMKKPVKYHKSKLPGREDY